MNKQKKVRTMVELSEADYKKLQELAAKDERSYSWYAAKVLKEHLNKVKG